jgi:beta-lactamase superfamily II metal-dependent hydrolase
MRSIRLAVCGSLLSASCAGAPEPPPYRAVADVKQLMNAMIDPQADEIWDATGWIITAAGEEERRPKNDEEWLAVMHHAVTVTEAGNLLMMAPRAKDGDLWMKRSQELIDAGQKVWRAAESKDVQKLFDTGGELYESCLHCHGDYIDAIKNAK